MPTSPATACVVAKCPGRAVRKGRCAAHAPANDGYASTWRALSLAVRREVGACQDCGSRQDLTVDHLVPRTLGGTDARSNLRVRCRSCHQSNGLRSSVRAHGRGPEGVTRARDHTTDGPRDQMCPPSVVKHGGSTR